jgi:hypothetical protein
MTKTSAELARDIHAQFIVLREGKSEVAAHSKRLGNLRIVEWAPPDSVHLPLDISPSVLSSRLVDAIFGSNGSAVLRLPSEPATRAADPLPVAEASEGSWTDWDTANRS